LVISFGILMLGASGQSSRVYALSGLACQNSGVLLAAAGAWFFICGMVPEHGSGLEMVGRIVGWLFTSSAFGEAVWVAARCGFGTNSFA
jgi:hypothetical protein